MMAAAPALTRVGNLEVLDLGARPGPGVSTIIMFHGYGADAYDLSSLCEDLELPASVRWVFPQGPMTVPIGPGFYGRAWFPIDVEAHEKAMANAESVDYSERRSPQMDQARERALKMLAALKVDLKTTILGGFSQGSMLAVDMTLHLPTLPAGLVVLSGTLVDEPGVRTMAPRHQGMRFFQSHGQRDDILPFSGADRLNRTLTDCGWDGYLLSFNGGHEIPQKVLVELQSYLQSTVSKK